jgi:predicted neuraminidase
MRNVWPFIDERVVAVGTSHLRLATAEYLSKLGDKLLLVRESDIPLAVVVSYETWLKVQKLVLESEK